MTSPDDGGPAFPMSVEQDKRYFLNYSGMSIRDWFAGMAMQSIIAKQPYQRSQDVPPEVAYAAGGAYEYADAMLARRKENSDG